MSKKSDALASALEVMKRVGKGDFEARITHIEVGGDLGELLHGINDMIDRCDAYVRESSATMQHVSENKYYRKIVETGMLGAFLNASRTVNSALTNIQHRVDEFSELTIIFEVHISNIHARDIHHKHSILSEVSTGVICGLGPYGYMVGMQAAAQKLGILPDSFPDPIRVGPQ